MGTLEDKKVALALTSAPRRCPPGQAFATRWFAALSSILTSGQARGKRPLERRFFGCGRSAEVLGVADFCPLLARAAANGASDAETLTLRCTKTYAKQPSRPLTGGRTAVWQGLCGCLLDPGVIGPTAAQRPRLRPENRNDFSRTRCRDGAA
jgi:hypothetical protein